MHYALKTGMIWRKSGISHSSGVFQPMNLCNKSCGNMCRICYNL